MADIFNFDSQDLIQLQGWYRKQPRQFTKAAKNVLNAVAGSTKQHAILNVMQKTTTRAPNFVRNSIRAQNARQGASLNNLVAETFSFDISKKGRSSGFEELEDGGVDKRSRVQSVVGRVGGKKTGKVRGKVRMNKAGGFHRRKQFRGSASSMLRQLRSKKITGPVIIDRKVSRSGRIGKLRAMKPGVYNMIGGSLKRMQIFDATGKRVKKIGWMDKAVDSVTSTQALKVLWGKEVDKVLKKR